MNCNIDDTTLLSCDHRGIGIENCDHSEDVALECIGGDRLKLSELNSYGCFASQYLAITLYL